MNERISFDELWIGIVLLLEKRSTCLRRKVGAVIVKDNVLLSTGWNGAPSGMKHCDVCIRKRDGIPSGTRLEYCKAVHAEQNALLQCIKKQTNCEGATLYCSNSPCVTCAKLLIQLKIKRIVYLEEYNDDLSFSMLNEAGIELIKYKPKWEFF